MNMLVGLLGFLLILTALLDAFETVILPRRVSRRLRISVLVTDATWRPWRSLARRIRSSRRRESFLSYYGPLGLLLLLASWAVTLIVGFGLLQWAFGSRLSVPYGKVGLLTDLYMSGTTFVTLGLGDVAPLSTLARVATVVEAATGFAFLALIIGYAPVLYQAFSQREQQITLLDARAGSPPTGVEALVRYAQDGSIGEVAAFFGEWERWSATLLESHLSYPSLAFYRSQHDNQSWLAALTAILDASALVLAGLEGVPTVQARLAFGMGRHAAVDLSQVLRVTVRPEIPDRLPPAALAGVRARLAAAGIPLRDGAEVIARLTELRSLYEPYIVAMSAFCMLSVPSWLPADQSMDDWQRTGNAWDRAHQLSAELGLE